MSFDELKKLLHGTESIDNYDKVLAENEILKRKSQAREAAFIDQLSEKDAEIDRLRKRIKYLEGLRRKYPKGTYNLDEFELQVQSGIDLEERKQIELGVDDRWQTEKPKLLLNALRDEMRSYPDKCLPETRALIDKTSETARDSLLRSEVGWPLWFKELHDKKIQAGVQRGLDAKFYALAEEKSQRELSRKVNIEWPNHVRNYMTPWFQRIWREELMNVNVVHRFTCDRCGLAMEIQLTADTLANLIQQPNIVVQCINPGCRDLLWPHNIRITLGQVLYTLMQKNVNTV